MSFSPRILFLGKGGEPTCARAAEFLSLHAPEAEIHLGKRGDPLPHLRAEAWDYILSYLSPWVVPASLLKKGERAAINFHTGPPEYPGVGCTNFALYEGATRYGVTCHHMEPTPDTGRIIQVDYFSIQPGETVLSLTHRCYAYLAQLFYEIADLLLQGKELPAASERWTRHPFRRSELEELCRLTPEMSAEEIERRIRATTFPGFRSASFEPSAELRR